jgi:hypothetical protein
MTCLAVLTAGSANALVYNSRMPLFKYLFLPLASGLVLVFLLGAQTNVKDEVLKADAAYTEAKIKGDVEALDQILADDYIGVNQWGGGVRNKQEVLELFRTGYHGEATTPSNIGVQISGDAATTYGLMNVANAWRFTFVRTFVKRHGRWQLLSMAQVLQIDPTTMKPVDIDNLCRYYKTCK